MGMQRNQKGQGGKKKNGTKQKGELVEVYELLTAQFCIGFKRTLTKKKCRNDQEDWDKKRKNSSGNKKKTTQIHPCLKHKKKVSRKEFFFSVAANIIFQN